MRKYDKLAINMRDLVGYGMVYDSTHLNSVEWTLLLAWQDTLKDKAYTLPAKNRTN